MSTSGGDAVCYRHPDRRAGVGCQRCGKPICPSCMNTASVGFHCPECVRTGKQKVIPMRAINALEQPYVTFVLIALNVVMFVVVSIDGRSFFDAQGDVLLDYALLSGQAGVPGGFGVRDGEWYRIITGGFLHSGLIHLLFNMWALWVLGPPLENRLGRVNFIVLYFAGLVGGSSLALALDTSVFVVGASGAIFGLFGAYGVAQWSAGINPLTSQIGMVLMLNLFITFAVPRISIGGHLGGLLGGAAVGYLFYEIAPRLPDRRLATPIAILFTLGLFALGVLAANR